MLSLALALVAVPCCASQRMPVEYRASRFGPQRHVCGRSVGRRSSLHLLVSFRPLARLEPKFRRRRLAGARAHVDALLARDARRPLFALPLARRYSAKPA